MNQEAEDEIAKKCREPLNKIEDERFTILEAANANKDVLRGQRNRINETIGNILKEDTTLRERLKHYSKNKA